MAKQGWSYAARARAWPAAILALCSAAAGSGAAEYVPVAHSCVHDQYVARQPPALTLNQSYEPVPVLLEEEGSGTGSGRRTQALNDGLDAMTAGYQPIRIKSESIALAADGTGMNAAKVAFVNSLAQAVADRWAEMLSVSRVSGNLFASRSCTSSVGAGNGLPARCVTFADTSCGGGGPNANQDVPIPFNADYYAAQTYYPAPTYTTASTTVGGTGIPQADFLMFVTAKHVTGQCLSGYGQSGTLAYASTCQRDQFDRPTFGRVNYCPYAIPETPPAVGSAAYNDLFAVALHEYAHALGFSSSSWPLFRNWDANRTPKTPRSGYWQNVVNSVTYTCNGNSYTRTYADATTVDYFAERGMSKCTMAQSGQASENCVVKHVGPRSMAAAREHFACSTLNGAELENQLTTACSFQGSHWEQRLFNTELMSSYLTAPSLISAVTLAMFEDSGWYKANYAAASNWRAGIDWGYKQGCAFATDKCIEPSTGVGTGSPAHFVSTNAQRCTVDRRGYGVASFYSGTVPTQYQYFPSDVTKMGTSYIDYCPVVSPYSNTVCDQATNLANLDLHYGQYWAQTNSVCMESSLLRKGYSGSGPGVGCYTYSCTGSAAGAYTLTITTRNSADYSFGDVNYPQIQTATCTSAEKGQSKTLAGYNGAITCPDVDALCTPAAPLVPAYVSAASSGGGGTVAVATATATASSTTSSSATASRSASATASRTALPTTSATSSRSATSTASGSAKASTPASATPSRSAESTATATRSAPATGTPTRSAPATATASRSAAATQSVGVVPTSSATQSAVATRSSEATGTATSSVSALATATTSGSATASTSATASATASPSSQPVAVSATLVIRGLSKAEAEAAGPAFRDAIIQGLAALLGIPASRIRIKTIYVAGAGVRMRALSLTDEQQQGLGAALGSLVYGRPRALVAGDVAVDFSVETTAGPSQTSVTSAITSALPASGGPSASFAAAVTTLVSNVAVATGKAPGALAMVVPPSSIVAAPVVAAPSPASAEASGPSMALVIGAAVGAVVVLCCGCACTWYCCCKRADAKDEDSGCCGGRSRRSAKVAPSSATMSVETHSSPTRGGGQHGGGARQPGAVKGGTAV